MTDPTNSEANPVPGHGSSWASKAVALLAVLVSVLLLQQFFGLGLTVRIKIDPQSIKLFKDNKAFRFRLPEGYTSELVAAKGQILENGVPLLNRRSQAHDAVNEGGGTYNFKPPHVRFSAPDDTDIRSNGRHYELLAPKQFNEDVFYWLTGLLLICLAFAIRTGAASCLPVGWRIPQAWFFAGALAVTIGHVFFHPDLSSGSLLVKGMPESDAGGWHHMALELKQGLGIMPASDSQRPYYSVMLASVYMIFGHSILVAKLFHAVILSVVATLMLSMATALRKHWVGVVAGSVLVWSEEHDYMMHSILTENAGLLFATLGVLALWICSFGHEQKSLKLPALAAFIAGLLVALGNLASGVMLMLVPTAPFLLVAMQLRLTPNAKEGTSWIRWPSFDSLRRGLLIAAAFTFGVCLMFLPWMSRQYSRYGVFTLSTNTGELLYGGADPVNGKLTGANFHLPEQAGLDPNNLGLRMKFYMAKYKEQVASAPLAYIQQVGRAWAYVFKVSPLDSPALRAGLLVLLLGLGVTESLRRGNLIPAIVAVKMMIGWMYLPSSVTLPLLIVASALCLWRQKEIRERWLVALIVATLVCGTFLSAMAGAVGVGRFWTVIDWTLILLVCLGFAHAHKLFSNLGIAFWNRIRGWRSPASKDNPPAFPAHLVGQWLSVTRGAAACSLLAIMLSGARTWIGPSVTSPDFTSARALQENIVQWVVQQHPDAAVHSFASKAQASLALDDGRAGFFAAGEDIGTFLADYQRRDYPRWVVVPQLLNDQGTLVGATSMQCRSEATKWQTLHQPALWVWVPGEGMNRILHETELTHEVLAIIPLKRSSDGKQWEADKAATRWIRGW